MAESEGFEPPDGFPSTVFKTAAFDHSASSPFVRLYCSDRLYYRMSPRLLTKQPGVTAEVKWVIPKARYYNHFLPGVIRFLLLTINLKYVPTTTY